MGSTVSEDAETVARMTIMLLVSCTNLGTDASPSGTVLAAVATAAVWLSSRL
jgi:hypothetical protein